MDKKSLLEKLSALEFAAVDMQLYLNTHPTDKAAIKVYNDFVNEAMDVREEYEKNFGPLFSFVTMSDENRFDWIDSPWSWEAEFNRK